MSAVALGYGMLHFAVVGHLLPPFWTMQPIRFFAMAFPQVLLGYARILIWPYDLHTDRVLSLSHTLPYAALAVCALLGQWLFIRGPRWARFWAIWYVLMLLPKSPLMMAHSDFMSDHWAYPALPALAFPLAWCSPAAGTPAAPSSRR
jgi:hypothetical protein